MTAVVLYCIVLYCIVLYCIVLYCIVLYCIVLLRLPLQHKAGVNGGCSLSMSSSSVSELCQHGSDQRDYLFYISLGSYRLEVSCDCAVHKADCVQVVAQPFIVRIHEVLCQSGPL